MHENVKYTFTAGLGIYSVYTCDHALWNMYYIQMHSMYPFSVSMYTVHVGSYVNTGVHVHVHAFTKICMYSTSTLPSILIFFCCNMSCCFLRESTAAVSSSASLLFLTSSFCWRSQWPCMLVHRSTLSDICFCSVSIFSSSGPRSSPWVKMYTENHDLCMALIYCILQTQVRFPMSWYNPRGLHYADCQNLSLTNIL